MTPGQVGDGPDVNLEFPLLRKAWKPSVDTSIVQVPVAGDGRFSPNGHDLVRPLRAGEETVQVYGISKLGEVWIAAAALK